jgi:hypothetical protein
MAAHSMTKPILIVGGGPAGLAAAHASVIPLERVSGSTRAVDGVLAEDLVALPREEPS